MVIDCLKWYQNDRTLFKIIVDDIWWSKRIFKTIDLNGPLIYEDDWYTWNHLSKTVLICHSYLAKFLQFLNWVGLGPSDLWICLFSLFYVFSLSLMVEGEEINSIHLPTNSDDARVLLTPCIVKHVYHYPPPLCTTG